MPKQSGRALVERLRPLRPGTSVRVALDQPARPA
jgi:hypothetical protein